MPDDDLISFDGFEIPDSTKEKSNLKEVIAHNLDTTLAGDAELPNASAGMFALLDPLGHLLTDELKSSLPSLVIDALKANLTGFLFEALKDTLPKLIQESVQNIVQQSLGEHVSLVLTQDMNFLLEVVEVFKKANAEGEKWEKNNLETPTQEANAQIPDPAQGEKQTEDDHMSSEEHISVEKDSDNEPPIKKLKFLIPTSKIPTLTPLNSVTTEFFLQLITSSQDATMRITRGNDLLNVVAKKLGVPPLPQLLTFGISNKDKKRKRTFEIIQEVFVKEDVVVDGMYKKLAPPSDSEFHLATTIQLVRLQGSILRDAPEGEEMFKLIELEIESRKDAVKAKEIIKDNLDGIGQHYKGLRGTKGLTEYKALASNITRIQVKDIVKEVEDYLKTYSSARMDISWYVEGIR
ncbi:hypothetical protein Tco_0105953 [Tanacetum coccineum]